MKPDSKLLQKAVRMLGRRAHSRRELETKLRRRAPVAAVDAVLDRLDELGYLDDAEYARQRAKTGRRRHWANRRIRLDLKAHGVAAALIESAVCDLEAASPERKALAQLADRWIARKGRPRRAADLKKLFDACGRAGFPQGLVREELGHLFKGLEWE